MAPALAILCVEEAPPPDPPASAAPPPDPPAPAAAAAARVHDSLLEWWSRLAAACWSAGREPMRGAHGYSP